LVGKPPFETSSLKDTYSRIKKNEYIIPSTKVSPAAKRLIENLLQADPTQRPNMAAVLEDEFFTSGFFPAGLPTSCLTMAPRSDTLKAAEVRKPLLEVNSESGRPLDAIKKEGEGVGRKSDDEPADCYLSDLLTQLTSVINAKPVEKLGPRSGMYLSILFKVIFRFFTELIYIYRGC
jgi:polo-like kinase 1